MTSLCLLLTFDQLQDVVKKWSSVLSTVLHSAIAGPTLANKLLSLCLAHYRLASTTVTGIPMKEEQVRTPTNHRPSILLCAYIFSDTPSQVKIS